MSAEAVEDASDTTKSLEGIQIFRIQQARELIRFKRERTKVRWSILEGGRIGNLCLSIMLSLR